MGSNLVTRSRLRSVTYTFPMLSTATPVLLDHPPGPSRSIEDKAAVPIEHRHSIRVSLHTSPLVDGYPPR